MDGVENKNIFWKSNSTHQILSLPFGAVSYKIGKKGGIFMDYAVLNMQVRALTEGVPHVVANLANTSAAIWQAMDNINWAGFYLMEQGKLVLGPFQGKPACIRIPLGKGVCGTAAETKEIQLVLQNQDYSSNVDLESLPSETARMAMAIIVAGPALFVFPFFQKYFVKGLTVGSVKG